MSTYSEWSEALEKELADPFPEEWVQTKTLKGNRIAFVPWHRYAAKLNELVGPQGWAIPEPRMQTLGTRTVLFVGLTIHGVTKWDVGEEHHEVVDKETGEMEEFNGYGGPVLNAYAQAMKRAAAKFGLGLYLYDKSAPRQQPSGNGGGRKLEGAATGKQLGLIESLMRSSVITDKERDDLGKRAARGMSKAEASKAIDWLNDEIERRKTHAVMP